MGDYDPYWIAGKYQWHHVVPCSLEKNDIFKENGALANLFDINDPKNCVALPTDCDEAFENESSPHRGRHNDAYKQGMSDLLDRWQKNFEAGTMTQAQVRLRFGMMLRLVSAGLDPKLAEVMPDKYTYQGDALLSQQDKRLDDPDRRFLKEFLPDPDRPNCSVEQRERYERAMNNSVSIIELLNSEADLVAQGKMKPIEFMREQEPGFAQRFLHDTIVRGPDINRDVGVAVASAGAFVALSATGAGLLAAPAAETGAGATIIPFVQRSAPLVKEGAAEALQKVAALAGLSVLTAAPADASLKSSHAPTDILPNYPAMNAGTDHMGERGEVDRICWRFTGLPAGHAGNTPYALYMRDTDVSRKDGALDHGAGHLLLRADGSIERSEQFSRPWTANPQIKAGENGNAIGLYVEGTDELTREQRMAMTSINEALNIQRQSSTGRTAVTALSAASLCEQSAWAGNQPVIVDQLPNRISPRPSSPNIAMGQ